MVVFVLERAPTGVRGELSRWLLEPHAGVFVGKVSAEVRDRLWDLIVRRLSEREADDASAVLVYAAETEQGYSFRIHGDPTRDIAYFEGLELVRIRSRDRE